eukprot:5715544-Pyramimonas_sp.AAC.1
MRPKTESEGMSHQPLEGAVLEVVLEAADDVNGGRERDDGRVLDPLESCPQLRRRHALSPTPGHK